MVTYDCACNKVHCISLMWNTQQHVQTENSEFLEIFWENIAPSETDKDNHNKKSPLSMHFDDKFLLMKLNYKESPQDGIIPFLLIKTNT